MTAQRVVMVVDMQNGVFATPRLARERCVAQINRLVRAADKVIFIQHDEAGGLEAGSEGFALLPELEQPAGLTIPGNPLQVKPTETILHAWQQN